MRGLSLRARAAIILMLTLGATTCTDPDGRLELRDADAIVVTDGDGETVLLEGPARRIVSLVPSATATLHAIGATEAIIGRTDFDTASWVADVPSVGGGLGPSLEALVALRPDLVIRFAGDQDLGTRDRLRDLEIPYLTVDPESLEDLYETIDLLGSVTGRTDAGDSLTASLRASLGEIERLGASRPPVSFVYVLGGTPPWVAGPGTYIDDLLTLAGGTNAFADLHTLYAAVSPEELVARQIDVVLVSSRTAFDATLVPGARLVEIGDGLEMPGPGVAEAAAAVVHLMHGLPHL